MGMYDYVDYETKCPLCGKKVTNFQSKSGACMLETLKPEEAHHFYSSCDACKNWVDCEVVFQKFEIKETWEKVGHAQGQEQQR